MSPPEKGRRGAGGSTNGQRGSSSSRDQPTRSQTTRASTPSRAGSNNPIATPARAQLTSSSPSPDDHPSRGRSNAAATTAATTRSKTRSASSNGKDLRIAALERELDELSRSESETAAFWQAKHSALNQQFLRTDTELRLLRDEWRARDDEVWELRAQVRGLKEWVSTSTRADDLVHTSDEVFGDGMARLGNGLQNWCITNFRRARLDLSGASADVLRELDDLVPMHEELAKTAKLHLLQSIVSRVLVDMVFGAYFVGLTVDQEEQLKETEKLMASFGSVESVSQWRSVTLSILIKEAAEAMQVQTAQITENIIIRINRILNSITTDIAVKSSGGSTTVTAAGTEARDQALRQLVLSAIDLSRLLVVQKAVLEVWMPEILPHQQVLFDHAAMEDIGGEDEENLVSREICCVTFPGIVKRGDENGTQLQFRNVISKAKVLCSPE